MNLAAFPKCFMDALCVERSMSVLDWIALAEAELKPLGVTGLEFYHGFVAPLSGSELVTVKHALEDAGLAMPMFCASPDFTSSDPAHRASEVARQKQMIDLAAFFGATTCRVLSGQRRPEVSREDGVRYVLESIKELLPYAQEHGVILAMENHFKDDYWQHPEFAQKMSVFMEIVEQIDSPWFGVNFDPSNTLIAQEDPLQLLERVKERVVSMHASDRRLRPGVTPKPGGITDYADLVHGQIGTGLIDFDAIFGTLRGVGFDGWVSIEDGVTGIDELKRSATFLAGKLRQ